MSFASKIDVGTSVLGSDQLKASPVASALCKVAPVEKEPSCQPAKHLPTLHFAKHLPTLHLIDLTSALHPAACMCSTFILKSFSNKLVVDGDVLSAVGSTQFSGNKTQVLRDLSGPSPLVNLFCKTITMKTVGLVNQG